MTSHARANWHGMGAARPLCVGKLAPVLQHALLPLGQLPLDLQHLDAYS